LENQETSKMTVLVDHQINELLVGPQPLATHVPQNDYQGATSRIQAASLDLSIGGIFIPGTDPEKPGGAYTPLNEFSLAQGHTAVIRTKEELHLGPQLAGIAFPPASLSLKGLLMTNPGHIDPGYHGPLHLTVINMSRLPFGLKISDRIIRVLFVELGDEPDAPYNMRHPNVLPTSPITPELLERLSIDFLDVEKRASDIVDVAVRKAQLSAMAIPIVVAVITLIGSVLAANLLVKSDIQKLGERVAGVESKQTLEDRVHKLEEGFTKLNTTNAPR
jgi:dCTP deaminase